MRGKKSILCCFRSYEEQQDDNTNIQNEKYPGYGSSHNEEPLLANDERRKFEEEKTSWGNERRRFEEETISWEMERKETQKELERMREMLKETKRKVDDDTLTRQRIEEALTNMEKLKTDETTLLCQRIMELEQNRDKILIDVQNLQTKNAALDKTLEDTLQLRDNYILTIEKMKHEKIKDKDQFGMLSNENKKLNEEKSQLQDKLLKSGFEMEQLKSDYRQIRSHLEEINLQHENEINLMRMRAREFEGIWGQIEEEDEIEIQEMSDEPTIVPIRSAFTPFIKNSIASGGRNTPLLPPTSGLSSPPLTSPREDSNNNNSINNNNNHNNPSLSPSEVVDFTIHPRLSNLNSFTLNPLTQERIENLVKNADSEESMIYFRKVIKLQSFARGWVARATFKLLKKRTVIFQEFLKTEESYVDNLGCVIRYFILPLREKINSSDVILTIEDMNTLFSSIEFIHTYDKRFLNAVLSKYNSGKLPLYFLGSYLAHSFIEHMKYLAPPHIQFAASYKSSQEALKRFQKTNPAFEQFLKSREAEPDLKLKDINDFLIEPIQRPLRWVMLVQQILKCTPFSHPDHNPIEMIYHKLRQLAEDINTRKKQVDDMEALQERLAGADDVFTTPVNVVKTRTGSQVGNPLNDKINVNKESSPVLLTNNSASRHLVKEGDIYLLEGKTRKPRRLFLFNDMIIIAKRESKRSGFRMTPMKGDESGGKSADYHTKVRITFDQNTKIIGGWISEYDPRPGLEFSVIYVSSDQGHLTVLSTENPIETKAWVGCIQETLDSMTGTSTPPSQRKRGLSFSSQDRAKYVIPLRSRKSPTA